MDRIMPTFDTQIAQVAQRMLVRPRKIDHRAGVFAAEVTPGVPGERPVRIKMIDANTKEHVETMEVDACMVATGRVPFTSGLGLEEAGIETERGFLQTTDKMEVLDKKDGSVVPHLYCIGDANGKMMLAHAASAQGISAVENIAGHEHKVNHNAIPAACFTHPEIAFVGLDEAAAKAKAESEQFELGIGMGNFRANSKALAEASGEGVAKVMFKKDTREVLGVHIVGLHAADLIQECANAIELGTTIDELAMITHTHPTLSEVLDEVRRKGPPRAHRDKGGDHPALVRRPSKPPSGARRTECERIPCSSRGGGLRALGSLGARRGVAVHGDALGAASISVNHLGMPRSPRTRCLPAPTSSKLPSELERRAAQGGSCSGCGGPRPWRCPGAGQPGRASPVRTVLRESSATAPAGPTPLSAIETGVERQGAHSGAPGGAHLGGASALSNGARVHANIGRE